MKWLAQQFASNSASNRSPNCAVSDSPGGECRRTAAAEVLGRGTNRVIEEFKRWGGEPPSFDIVTGSLWVNLPAVIGPTAQVTDQDTAQVTAQVAAMLEAAAHGPVSREALQEAAQVKHRELRKDHLEPALNAGLPERAVPDKPRSPKQRYRITEAGRRLLDKEKPDA